MPRIAVRVDGNRHIGMGHVFRQMHLADHLAAAGYGVLFLLLESSAGETVRGFLGARGIDCMTVSRPGNPWRADSGALARAYADGGYDAAVLDLLVPDPGDDDLLGNSEYVPAELGAEVAVARGEGLPVCLFSDRFDRMEYAADVVVNTCPAQRAEWYDSEDGVRRILGARAYVLAPAMADLASRPKTFTRTPPRVLVFCGGHDHRGFTPYLLDGIAASGVAANVEVVLGAGTPDPGRARAALAGRVRTVHHGVPDLAPILADADFVFSASGNTLFDLAGLGVPCAAVSTRERQRVTARFFASRGCCVDLGMDLEAVREGAADVCREVLADPTRLAEMSARGRETVDGRGAERIVRALADAGAGERA